MYKLKLKIPKSDCCDIYVGPGLLDNAGSLIKKATNSSRGVVITDTNVGTLYRERLTASLLDAGIKAEFITVPCGEEQKNLKTASDIYSTLTELGIDRGNPVIALGGGVVGDLAGFVGATYMRGLPLIQIPTSLVAQVDSSIGGKVAVNFGSLKNLIGAFYQPCLVLSDTGLINSLAETEFTNGLAEIIKSAAVFDAKLFCLLEDKIESLISKDEKLLSRVIYQTAKVKVQIVKSDERDRGLRQILNFGHTIGHAIETCSSFNISHGQAVAIGMVLAARLSNILDILDAQGYDRLKNLIIRARLPAYMPRMDTDAIIKAMKHDKKIKNGRVSFVMLASPGAAVISSDISFGLIQTVIEQAHE